MAAGRGGGGDQVVADVLPDPGALPGRQPGAGQHGGQPLGERAHGALLVPAREPVLPPPYPDHPVPQGQVAGRGDVAVPDRPPGAAARALPGLFQQARTGHDVRGHPPVPVLAGTCHDQAGNPQQHRRRRAPRHAAGQRGLRVPGAAGSVHGRRFLLRIRVSGRNENGRGTAFLFPGSGNSQPDPWKCGLSLPLSGSRKCGGAEKRNAEMKEKAGITAPAGRRAGRHGTLPGLRSLPSLPVTVRPGRA